MSDAAEDMRKFAETLQASVDGAARRLAPRSDPAMSIAWASHDNGDQSVIVTLRSGRVIRGRGPAKLEALSDAAERVKSA